MEQAHIIEYQEFNKQWDQQLGEIEGEHNGALRGLEERHVKELEENRQMLE